MSFVERPTVGYSAFLITLFLIVLHTANMKGEYDSARAQYVKTMQSDAVREGRKIETAFRSIHQNMKLAAELPSVVNIDHSGLSGSSDGRVSIKKLRGQVARAVSNSRLYIVPLGLDISIPSMAHSPNLQQVGLDAIGEREYAQLKRHQNWLKDHYPTHRSFGQRDVPMISGPALSLGKSGSTELRRAKSQPGLMFSVPFYGPDGRFKGSVSVIVPSEIIQSLLPSSNYALLNEKYKHVFRPQAGGKELHSAEWVKRGKPDPDLMASAVIGVAAFDPRSTWRLWIGMPDSAFFENPVVKTIRVFEIGGHLGIGMLLSLLLFMQWLGTARMQERWAKCDAKETKEAHMRTLEAEREARSLNEDLQENMRVLSEAQRELVKHERLAALGQVTATLSHEIRNPLGAIRSSLYFIRQAVEQADIKLDRPLDRIERSVARCDNLIDDFLEYTRTHELSILTVDASEFLNTLLDEQTLPEGIKLTRNLPVPGGQIAVDPDRFLRVIINLVDNAAQAIKETGQTDGEVTVSCAEEDGYPVICVRDNGPGIPGDVLDRIFEPLFTTKSFGAGLGLATVKQLIEQHEAKLKIDTEVGVGTTFKVVLPKPSSQHAIEQELHIQEKAA